MIACNFCSCDAVLKNGYNKGLQRYKCKSCLRNFTQTPLRGVPYKDKLKALALYSSGLSMNRIAVFFGVSAVAVMKWIRTLGEQLCPKPAPSKEDQVIVMEVDEFWHYIKKKHAKCGSLKPMIVLESDLYPLEGGDRSHHTFQRLYNRLKRWRVVFYRADHWRGFNKVIPGHRLHQGKSKTYSIEQNNSRQRHWFARFKRKSLVVTKSLQMLEITMRIFAAVHVNKTCNLANPILS